MTAEIHVEVVCVAPLQVGEHRHLGHSFKERDFFARVKCLHLLLDDFILLGLLSEAFSCTLQVPQVYEAVQGAPV